MVGKSDFNENPVVSLDLDLDFGLGLRVCQLSHLLYFEEFMEIGCIYKEILAATFYKANISLVQSNTLDRN